MAARATPTALRYVADRVAKEPAIADGFGPRSEKWCYYFIGEDRE